MVNGYINVCKETKKNKILFYKNELVLFYKESTKEYLYITMLSLFLITSIHFYLSFLKDVIIERFNGINDVPAEILGSFDESYYSLFSNLNDHFIYLDYGNQFKELSMSIQSSGSWFLFSLVLLFWGGAFIREIIRNHRQKNSFDVYHEENEIFTVLFGILGIICAVIWAAVFFCDIENILFKLDNIYILTVILGIPLVVANAITSFHYFGNMDKNISRKSCHYQYTEFKNSIKITDAKKIDIFNSSVDMEILVSKLKHSLPNEEKDIIIDTLEEFKDYKKEENKDMDDYYKYQCIVNERFSKNENSERVFEDIKIEMN